MSAISVTHCKEVAAIALAPEGTCLGIDAESANRSNQLHRVANKFLSPHQQQQLQMLAENSQAKHSMLLTEAWTIKEAMYKALQISGLSLASIPLPEQLDSTLPFFGTIHFMDNIFDVCVSWIDTRLPERHSSCLAIVSSHICRLPF